MEGHVFMSSSLRGRVKEAPTTPPSDTVMINDFVSGCLSVSLLPGNIQVIGTLNSGLPGWLLGAVDEEVTVSVLVMQARLEHQVVLTQVDVDIANGTFTVYGRILIDGERNEKS